MSNSNLDPEKSYSTQRLRHSCLKSLGLSHSDAALEALSLALGSHNFILFLDADKTRFVWTEKREKAYRKEYFKILRSIGDKFSRSLKIE